MNRTAIALVEPKFPHNVGAAIRAASCFGTPDVVYTGDRFGIDSLKRLPREERMKGYRDVSWSQVGQTRFLNNFPDMTPVAVELVPGAEPLHTFEHPDNAVYIFGPEDGSLPAGLRAACHRFVVIPSFHCTNLAAAIYIVLYDRAVKRWHSHGEPVPELDEDRGGWWHSPSIEDGAFP